MTLEQKLKLMLYEKGLMENEAKAVVERLKLTKVTIDLEDQWKRSVKAYPGFLLNALWAAAKAEAIVWMDENKHWARHFFDASAELPELGDKP